MSVTARNESEELRGKRFAGSENKIILLFSDGTGNSSGKLHKTNVWRMYQTVDLGVPQKPGDHVQVGRYDNGIGSSSNRLLAVIQGIFGWGLKRNIKSLYLFLCRNFREGDRICLFGFSRGAFTVRVLADLIDKQGIISHKHVDELDHLVADAYREYRRNQRPRMLPMRWLLPFLKWIWRGIIWLKQTVSRQTSYAQAVRIKSPISFLGVWDTVSAYGGPIVEFVRAVDDWIVPISFKDRQLPACVQTARHALALDDERDSFQPLPWDERSEADPDRLKQVWFAGMHSDVGGGYPDDSLSYVSFIWMIGEAWQRCGLRFRPDRLLEANTQADSFGPIHDSRAGAAGYYRYQPRRISALMYPANSDPAGRYLIDPELDPRQGMIPPVKVHESVFRRIASGTDGYAPLTIPRWFTVVRDADDKRTSPATKRFLNRIVRERWQAQRASLQERIWDGVWKRRILYFLIVMASLTLLFMPVWTAWTGQSQGGAGGIKELLRLPIQGLDRLTLNLLHFWFTAFIAQPFVALALTASIYGLFQLSRRMEKTLRRECAEIWLRPTSRSRADRSRPKSLISRLRTFWLYQDILRFVRWNLLPAGVGIALLVAMLVAIVNLASVGRMTWNDVSDAFCVGRWPDAAEAGDSSMDTANPCNLTAVQVATGRDYRITLVIPEESGWYDGSRPAGPRGIAAGSLMPRGLDYFFIGMRRALDARWMQPLAYIVSQPRGTTVTEPLVFDVYDLATHSYSARFTAHGNGRLAIAVNDAVPPWPLPADFFYRGQLRPGARTLPPKNAGKACVRVIPLDSQDRPKANLPQTKQTCGSLP